MARTNDVWETGVDESYIKTISPSGFDVLINGLNKHINFNNIAGDSGYGFRDNNGVIEVKVSGGDWEPILDNVIFNSPITVKDAPTFTYTGGKLTSIAYVSGTTKALTYNGDGTLNTLTITYPAKTPIVKTMHWTAGVLTSISVA